MNFKEWIKAFFLGWTVGYGSLFLGLTVYHHFFLR